MDRECVEWWLGEWWLGERRSDVGQRVCGMVIGEWWLGERRSDVGQRMCGMVVGEWWLGKRRRSDVGQSVWNGDWGVVVGREE